MGGRRFRDGVGEFIEVGGNPSEAAGGGGLEGGVNPNIYDILLPPGKDQERILGDYDPSTGRSAVVPMVGP